MIRIALADHDPAVMEELRRHLELFPEFCVVGNAASGCEIGPIMEKLRPNALILDLALPGIDSFALIQEFNQQWPDTRIVVISAQWGEANAREALACGADAYLMRETVLDDLTRAVRDVTGGRRYLSAPYGELAIEAFIHNTHPHTNPTILTRREQQVLELAAAGLSNIQISHKLAICRRTAETHRARALRKLGLNTSSELTRYALRLGLVRMED